MMYLRIWMMLSVLFAPAFAALVYTPEFSHQIIAVLLPLAGWALLVLTTHRLWQRRRFAAV